MQSCHSRAKLNRIINYWLNNPPQIQSRLEQHQYLILDGTFIHRPVSLITLMDAKANRVIYGQYGIEEESESDLLAFFEPLVKKGLAPKSFTTDGKPQVIRTIRAIWPNILIQRCLVHIQRQGLAWCRHEPKMTYSRKLREIFLQVAHIYTREERDQFIELVKKWEERYGHDIQVHPEKGRVFSDIRRARSMLLKALPDMFHYLEDPNIPRSTNGLEGYYSRVKDHYRQHRGLSKVKLNHYFRWYLFLKPR